MYEPLSESTTAFACRLLAICEGIIPHRKGNDKAASKPAYKPANSGSLSNLVALAEKLE